MTDTRTEYIARTKENLDLINAKITELEAKANEKKGDVRREFKEALASIRQSKEQAESRLEELRLASKPAWNDVKQGVEQAQNALSQALHTAAERFH